MNIQNNHVVMTSDEFSEYKTKLINKCFAILGIYEDCDVRLTEFEETGRMVLRVIIPDKHNRFPEDAGCDVRYTLQIFTTDFIYREGGWKI